MDFRQPEQAALRETLIPSIPPFGSASCAAAMKARVGSVCNQRGGGKRIKNFQFYKKTEKTEKMY
ncbi:hypothetical protein HMPREF3293_02608 [Christensenella minuta]|uniref:Uncharacterized protein n=1 Tax=Christensenella minuta TaxID=626937 RepID=A0A136Q1H1_9FIRM|nr:hypothetical protein HMPREF3293_02608 [Christensenella minuta]